MKTPSPRILAVLLLATGIKLIAQPVLRVLLLASLVAVLVTAIARLVLRRMPVRPDTRQVLTHPIVSLTICVLAIVASGAMIATQPRLLTAYYPDQLAGASEIDSQRGFYPIETDPAGNRYAWTQERATLVVNFLVHRPVTLTFEIRSAAVAGGPDAPVEVRVNGESAGTLRPDPKNAAFQLLDLRLVPYDWGGDQTEIKLLPTTFTPQGDKRTLGTMVKSISIDKTEAWSPIGQRLWLLGIVPVLAALAAGCVWVARRYRSSLAGYGALALYGIGALDAVILFTLTARIGVIARDTRIVWMLGSIWIALSFGVAVVVLPLGRPDASNLFHWIGEPLRARAQGLIAPLSAEPTPTRRLMLRDLALIFAIALGIRLIWVVIIPPWQSPDEGAHFGYIQHIVEQREIPTPRGQPYPYYSPEQTMSWGLTLLGRISAVGGSAPRELPYLPFVYDYQTARDYQAAGVQRWSQAGGSATTYPPPYYVFGAIPYAVFKDAPIVARLFAVRCASALLGALSCVFAYLLAYELRGTRRWGWALGFAMALMPMYAFITATVNNDAAMDLGATALIWLTVRVVQQERLSLRLALAVGLTSGLTLLTKPTIVPVVLIAGIVVCIKVLTGLRPSLRRVGAGAAAAGAYVGSAFILYLPWLLFRMRYYGDVGFGALPIAPFTRLLTDMTTVAASSPLSGGAPPIVVAQLSFWDYLNYEKVLGWTYFHHVFFRMFWGNFGWLDAPLEDRFYLPIVVFYALSGIGLLIQIFLQPARRRILLLFVGMLVAQAIFLFIGADWYLGAVRMGAPLGVQGRYFFPILAPLLYLLLSGWDHLWRERPVGLRLALAGIFALQLIGLATILARYYGVVIG